MLFGAFTQILDVTMKSWQPELLGALLFPEVSTNYTSKKKVLICTESYTSKRLNLRTRLLGKKTVCEKISWPTLCPWRFNTFLQFHFSIQQFSLKKSLEFLGKYFLEKFFLPC